MSNSPTNPSNASQAVTVTIEFEGTVNALPVLPLRDVVVFPHMVIPLFVGRPRSIKALEMAMSLGSPIVLVTQKNANSDEPTSADLHNIGCSATILQMLHLPDNTVKVLIEGQQRCELLELFDRQSHFAATIKPLEEVKPNDAEVAAFKRTLLGHFEQFVKMNQKIPNDVLANVAGIEELGRFTDSVAAHLPIKLEQRQTLLETTDIGQRVEKLLAMLEGELDILQVEKKIRGRVKKQIEKSQREYYLNEQVKAIQKELGEGDELADLDELAKRIKTSGASKEAQEKCESELKKLKMMSPMSAEATVVRNYLDTVLKLPWKKRSRLSKDLSAAQKILEAEHYGLEKVKERVIEYLAVQQRVDKMKSPIICLIGPPGVGKTSLGQSIARATNRKFVRMALGGVRDEAEIRGHRRTYIGSMPGRILQSLSKVGVRNPLFLLDEIDKIGTDFRGDPASALLEVLDPEQNHTFSDHYLEVDFDLSEVMFVATANTMNIPPALLDRMEIIRLSGYTEDEKVAIAKQYLIPKQIKNNGVKDKELIITEDATRDIARYYTREAGVRAMEREISKISRITVKNLLLGEKNVETKVTADNLEKYLGVKRYRYGVKASDNQIGICTGLAWTEVGGDLLTIEALALPGKGVSQFTGKLGEVMQESIKTALSVVRRRAYQLGINPQFYEKVDIHIHVPEGATPKDGPSAGAAMCTAIVSLLASIPVRADVAMTGEITLRGEVLEIGGLKEKLLAALRGGITKVLIPADNEKDLAEIPDNVKKGLEIVPVRWFDEVLRHALEWQPKPFEGLKDPMEALLTTSLPVPVVGVTPASTAKH